MRGVRDLRAALPAIEARRRQGRTRSEPRRRARGDPRYIAVALTRPPFLNLPRIIILFNGKMALATADSAGNGTGGDQQEYSLCASSSSRTIPTLTGNSRPR